MALNKNQKLVQLTYFLIASLILILRELITLYGYETAARWYHDWHCWSDIEQAFITNHRSTTNMYMRYSLSDSSLEIVFYDKQFEFAIQTWQTS